MILILRKTSASLWYAGDDYLKREELEYFLQKYIDKEGFKIIGMIENGIVLHKQDNPSKR